MPAPREDIVFQASSPLVEAQFCRWISVVFPPPTRTENHAIEEDFLRALSALLAGHGLALAQQIGSSPDPIGRETPPVGNRARLRRHGLPRQDFRRNRL
jgi:hypothetical protein